MPAKQPPDSKPHTWPLRDRTIPPTNKARARAMRLEPTEAERKLWWHLRHRLLVPGTHFRRQVRLGPYIVDFASHSLRLAIELDGGQHAERVDQDERRTQFLEGEGYRMLRFWNNDVLQNIDGVLEVIDSAISAGLSVGTTPTPTPPHKGEGKEK
jgi:very-short-patch-repair endonuclease